MNSSPSVEKVLLAHLQPGELLRWNEEPGRGGAGLHELKTALVPGLGAGLPTAVLSSSEPLPSIVP